MWGSSLRSLQNVWRTKILHSEFCVGNRRIDPGEVDERVSTDSVNERTGKTKPTKYIKRNTRAGMLGVLKMPDNKRGVCMNAESHDSLSETTRNLAGVNIKLLTAEMCHGEF
ncbi:hypothetical protein XENOCAPTIV_027769 [Xenoophorus captivus]|uniref:Uncharacterized protein n=1 Tax=Xenoophorus captivus TaxID=1517983 RepID=A0ABV0QK71_9TELE